LIRADVSEDRRSIDSDPIDLGAAPVTLLTDQRGFPRAIGAVDIGAYELDSDRIFTDTFGPLLQ
jgi:hypothetical protein